MLRKLRRQLRALLHRSKMERELDEELRHHIERQTELNICLGMNPKEARNSARRAFGGVEQAKERSCDARGLRWLEELWQDLRYGVRILLKNSGITLIAVLTLALGIGANTAIFSVVNVTLIQPLPYKNPNRILMVWGTNPGGYGWRGKTGFSAPNFLDYQQQNRVFERMATFNSVRFTLPGADNPETIQGGRVTADFFDVLAVQPILGRTFLAEEEQDGRDDVAILNYNFWQRRFGILFGLAPALQSTPMRLSESLKEGGRLSAINVSGLRLRRLLTVSEIALSMILLIGAGLLIRSFIGLLQVYPGFETKNILTARFILPEYSYPEATKQAAFYTQLMPRIKALPGVMAVGATDELPPTMGNHVNTFFIEGQSPIDQSNQSLAVQERVVSADYFRVMGISLIIGRVFSDSDDLSAVPVALINQTFARRFFPNENPIGQRLRFGSANPWITIVGIVGDVRGFGLSRQAKLGKGEFNHE